MPVGMPPSEKPQPPNPAPAATCTPRSCPPNCRDNRETSDIAALVLIIGPKAREDEAYNIEVWSADGVPRAVPSSAQARYHGDPGIAPDLL
jgi:hypothetical protein